MKALDIVIVNWNSGDQLRECLASLDEVLERDGVSANVIVVDNASDDGSCEGLPDGLTLTVERNRRNVGFAAACNHGASLGDAPYLLFLNPDTRLFDCALSTPLDFLASPENDRVAICGLKMLDSSGVVVRQCARFPTLGMIFSKVVGATLWWPNRGMRMLEWDHLDSRRVDQVMGAFFLVRRQVFEVLEGFDPRFWLYFEDVDFSLRAHRLGWHSQYLSGAAIFHQGGGTTRQLRGKRLAFYLASRLRYAEKHFSPLARVGHGFVTLVLEPPARIGFALTRGRAGEAADVLWATGRIWRDLLGRK